MFNRTVYIPQKDAKYFSKVWLSNTLKWVLKKYFLFKIAKFDKKLVNFPFFTVEHKNLKSYCKTIVQFLIFKTAIGESFGLLTIPGELFEDIGKRLIHQSPISQANTLIFQNYQDWIGYLFSLKIYIDEGGYEPFMCFSPLCGFYIETESIKLLKEVKKSSFD